MDKIIRLTYVVTPEDGVFSAVCKELATASCGDTVQEAFDNLHDAVGLHLDTLEDEGIIDEYFAERGIVPFEIPAQTEVRITGPVGSYFKAEDFPIDARNACAVH